MDAATPDPDRDLPALRASDTERHATAEILRHAYSEGRLTLDEFDERTSRAYEARFRSDLAGLTRDLVPAGHEPPAPPAHASAHGAAPARRVTGGSGPSVSLAVMGGSERVGTWTVPETHTVFALMGGVELDLRQASLQADRTTIVAITIMGGVEILVPDDVQIEVDGVGLMGGFGEDRGPWKADPRPVRQAPPGAPTIRVTGLALMGGVGVRRVPR